MPIAAEPSSWDTDGLISFHSTSANYYIILEHGCMDICETNFVKFI